MQSLHYIDVSTNSLKVTFRFSQYIFHDIYSVQQILTMSFVFLSYFYPIILCDKFSSTKKPTLRFLQAVHSISICFSLPFIFHGVFSFLLPARSRLNRSREGGLIGRAREKEIQQR